MAICYLEGIGVAVDFTKSLEWMTKAADDGSDRAREFLSGGIKDKNDGEVPFGAPDQFTEMRATAGNVTAQKLLGTCYLFGEGNLEQDEEKGFSWMMKVAEQGDDEAAKWVK